MKRIAYPAGIREEAAKMGCTLPTHAVIGSNIGSRFGAEVAARTLKPLQGFGTTTPPTAKPDVAKVVSSFAPNTSPTAVASSTGVAARQPTTLAFPPNLHAKTALAVADRALNSPNAKQIVETTQQIAALPPTVKIDVDPDVIAGIERAAAALDAARNIRVTMDVPPNQPIVATHTPDQTAAVTSAATASTVALSDADLEALASATRDMIESSRHHGLIERLLDWLKAHLT